MDPTLAAVLAFITGVGTFTYVLFRGLKGAEKGSEHPRLPGPAMGPWTFQRPEGSITVSREHDPLMRVVDRTPVHVEFTRVLLQTHAHLPQLTLRPRSDRIHWESFSERFAVRARGRGASILLASEELKRGLMAIARRTDTWDGLVSLRVDGSPQGSTLELSKEGQIGTEAEAAVLADALCGIHRAALEAWDEPWNRTADRWALGPIQRDGQGLRRLETRIDDATLRIEERVEQDELVVALEARIPGLTRFTGLRMAHRDEALNQGWGGTTEPTGNPVLDLCVAVRGAHRPGTRTLLDDPALTEALLPVVHGRRGILDSRGATLILLDPLQEDLEELAGELITLVRALGRRLATLEPDEP
jgi:hypothetical protein